MLRRLLIVLLFALIASPFLFKTVASLLGSWVASNAGTPTPAGLLLHGVVFLLLSGAVMRMAGGYRQYRSYRSYAEEPYEEYAEEPYEEEKYADEEKYAEETYAEEHYDEYRS